MAVQTFHTLADLSQAALQQAEHVDVVTFDVFDTLFVRRVHDPDQIKQPVARFINHLAKQAGVWCSFDTVQQQRNDIEAKHRQHNGQSNPDFEANYAEFMPEVLSLIHI